MVSPKSYFEHKLPVPIIRACPVNAWGGGVVLTPVGDGDRFVSTGLRDEDDPVSEDNGDGGMMLVGSDRVETGDAVDVVASELSLVFSTSESDSYNLFTGLKNKEIKSNMIKRDGPLFHAFQLNIGKYQ